MLPGSASHLTSIIVSTFWCLVPFLFLELRFPYLQYRTCQEKKKQDSGAQPTKVILTLPGGTVSVLSPICLPLVPVAECNLPTVCNDRRWSWPQAPRLHCLRTRLVWGSHLLCLGSSVCMETPTFPRPQRWRQKASGHEFLAWFQNENNYNVKSDDGVIVVVWRWGECCVWSCHK